jgi:RNA polymerase sigma-70 factor (ECF subfamily)
VRESIEQDVDSALRDAFGFDGERCDRIVAAVLAQLALAHPSVPSG